MEEKDENVVEETTQKNQQDPGDENVVKVDESKLLIKEILKSKRSNQSDIGENSKLKQIEDILSLISESNKESLEDELGQEDLLLVEKTLKPDALIEEIELPTDHKINKMNAMLNEIKKIRI